MNKKKPASDLGEVVIYRTDDGRTALDVRLAGETVWLSQAQIAKLVNLHLILTQPVHPILTHPG
jgi:hypothetical protein